MIEQAKAENTISLYGIVTMKEDKTLIVNFGSAKSDGSTSDGSRILHPSEVGYDELLSKVGGLEPGETKKLPNSVINLDKK